MNGLDSRCNSLAEFTVTMAIMPFLWLLPQLLLLVVSVKEPKAKQTKANLEKITKPQMWYNQQVEQYGMGKFPSQSHIELVV